MGLLNGVDRVYYEGEDLGNYQFTSLDDIISQFQIAYVGEDKIISKIKYTVSSIRIVCKVICVNFNCRNFFYFSSRIVYYGNRTHINKPYKPLYSHHVG